jgi:hypothetical protein
VQIRTTGTEKKCCTIILAIIADKQKLPPYVVFKHKDMAKEKFQHKKMAKEKLLHGITVLIQKSGWITEQLMTASNLYGSDNWVHCYTSDPCWF